jgi:hypothetical protein
MNPTLPQGPARRGFGFLSPPAPRACLGRTRVVRAPSLLPFLGEEGGGLSFCAPPSGRCRDFGAPLPEVMSLLSDMTRNNFSPPWGIAGGTKIGDAARPAAATSNLLDLRQSGWLMAPSCTRRSLPSLQTIYNGFLNTGTSMRHPLWRPVFRNCRFAK